MSMEMLELLRTLTECPGVSGSEMPIAARGAELLRPYCSQVEIQNGNVHGILGTRSSARPHALLDAHMDQVGFLVTAITEDGFIKVGNVGGMDCRLMPAQRVTVHGRRDIPGVIASVPPHLQNGGEHVLSVLELLIDTGLSPEALKQAAAPGDSVSFAMPLRQMQGDRVTGPALDDRCGMAAILRMLELVQGETLPCTVEVLFSVQEETGECGAITGGYTANPDVALAVDVTFALGHGEDAAKCGKMGGGPMIGLAPSLSRNVSEALIAAAEAEEISWQPEVMPGMTGTNADRFSVTRGGVCAGTVSIPLRYMHTPSEVIALSDVEQTAKLLAAYLRRCGTC